MSVSLNWNWDLTWHRNLFAWVEELVTNLMGRVGDWRVSHEDDGWKWRLEDNGVFFGKLNVQGVGGVANFRR